MPDAPLMLSVSGLRGIVGESLTPAVAGRFAAAMAHWLREASNGGGELHIVIGRDSRPSGAELEAAAAAALVAQGCRVTRLGVLSTPGVAVMAERLGARAGLVVTASHNPGQWNGLKPLVPVAGRIQAPPGDVAGAIIDRFRAAQPAGDASTANDDGAVDATVATTATAIETDDTGPRVHAEAVLGRVDVEAIRDARLKVVVDGVHGAGGAETARLLDALGVQLVHLFAEPTGDFPHTPEPLRENLGALCDAVREHGADVGFAQDPDADRLAIVDETGGYIGEEYTLALTCLHLLDRAGGRGAMLVANLSTSRMIDDVALGHGATVVRTPVGEANVAAAMQRLNALAGGEGNGGIIFPPITLVRDSIVGMALVLEMLARRKAKLTDIVRDIPAYAIVKEKTPVDADLIARLTPTLAAAWPEQRLDTQDGVRIDWPDRWVHVRPSNTEPIIRLIAEAASESEAAALIADVRRELKL